MTVSVRVDERMVADVGAVIVPVGALLDAAGDMAVWALWLTVNDDAEKNDESKIPEFLLEVVSVAAPRRLVEEWLCLPILRRENGVDWLFRRLG